MRRFFSKYGFIIIASLVICALLVIVSPLGVQIGNNISEHINAFSNVTTNGLNIVSVPSALGYKPKDTIKIGEKNYVILQDRGSNRYLVMDINGIGKREFNIDNNGQDPNKCKYDPEHQNWNKETCNNQYENSDIDEFLNNTYFQSLPQEVKDSIVEVSINQNFYATFWVNSKYRWVEKDDPDFDGCNNNACVLQSDGKWVEWNLHRPIKGEAGAYKYRITNKDESYFKRHVFLPSIEEIALITDVNDQYEMDAFLRKETGHLMHSMFRDGMGIKGGSSVMNGFMHFRSLSNKHVRYSDIDVRPTFVIDLKAYLTAIEN